LYLNENQLIDLNGLAKADLPKLTGLYLANNQLTDLNGLAKAKLPNLTNLHLYNNRLTDLNGLANINLPKLTKLTLNNNQISDVSPLATLTNLTTLHLNENQLIDLNGLAKADFSKLTGLYLANNQLTDLNGLAKADFSQLTELYLNNNRLTNLNGLVNAKLPSLAGLYLYDNQLTDLNGLANLTSLTVLYLPNNQISNINAISNLTNLTTLWLYNNQVNDISPLIANTGIKGTIKLRKNPLNNTSLSTHIPVMEARGIRMEYDEPPKGIIKMSDSGFEASLRQALTLPTKVITQTNVIGITNLNLANTGVIGLDVEALKMFPELEEVILTDNPLSRDAVLVQIPLLETTGIKVNLGSEAKLVALSVANPQIPASKAAVTTVTVTVKDAHDRLVKREIVTMAAGKGEIEIIADNQGDGTYTAAYTSTDTVGEAEITAVTGNGVVGTIKLKLVETVVSAKKSKMTVSAAPKAGETITVDVVLFSKEDLALSGKEVNLKISPMEGIEIENDTIKTDKYGKGQLKFIANSKGEKKIVVVSGEVELEQILEMIEAESQPSLVGDVNGDNSVNIFDLVIVAGQFGQNGANLSGDVNGDGSVNIFDLVISAGNFGKSAVDAAPALLTREMTFTTQQKRNIQSAIVQLESTPVRSEAEELAFNLLKAILPERLPKQTRLLPNYPNPFNPETWIPFELSQDSNVAVSIYDVIGTLVRSIRMGYLQAGNYVGQSRAIYWDGKTDVGGRVASGIYFYTLKTDIFTATQKMIILK